MGPRLDRGKRYYWNGMGIVVFLSSAESLDGSEENRRYFFARRESLRGRPEVLEAKQFTFNVNSEGISYVTFGDEFAGPIPLDNRFPEKRIEKILVSLGL